MNNLVEKRNGWLWPKNDKKCWDYMQNHPNLPELITEYVTDKKICVQAGGNAGFYVKKYAQIFYTVYTFEPEYLNFYCLCHNVKEHNVYKYQACLGNQHDLVSLKVKDKNRGKNFVVGSGTIPTFLIDDLGLKQCSLIHLDIEGFELKALEGAKNTIKQCKPVIVFEFFDKCASRYNYTLSDIDTLLQNLGYSFAKNFDEEYLYLPQNL